MKPAEFSTVDSVRPATRGHNLLVKVLESKVVVSRPKTAKNEGTQIAECIVGDETGVIVFSARNEQVDLAQPGAYVALRNAKVDMYRGSMRLTVDKWGKVEAAEGQSFAPNADNNLSLIEFELVAFDTINV